MSRLVELHRKVDSELRSQKSEYKSLRYSFGYPYQALHTLGVFGARSTEDRWDTYGLGRYLTASDTILDIGCNCGFMSLYSVFRTGCSADAIDINPYMLNVGRHCAEMLGVAKRVQFIGSDFTEFEEERRYDVVFSFAAHYTEDEQHRPDLREYMERIHELLRPDGLLVFESHGFDSTSPEFQAKIRTLGDLYMVEEHLPLFGGQRELFYFRRISKGDSRETSQLIQDQG